MKMMGLMSALTPQVECSPRQPFEFRRTRMQLIKM